MSFWKRLGGVEVAEVEEHLVPEAGVEQVKYGVLRTTDVEVDHAGFVVGPISLGFVGDETAGVAGIAVAEVIPAGAGPLRHGVGFADRAVGKVHPVGGLGEDGLREKPLGL